MTTIPAIDYFSGVEPSEVTLAMNQLIRSINAGFLILGGQILPPNYLGVYTVALLPVAPATGATAFASNGRKISETAGNGTGVLVYYSAGSWRDLSTDANVQA